VVRLVSILQCTGIEDQVSVCAIHPSSRAVAAAEALDELHAGAAEKRWIHHCSLLGPAVWTRFACVLWVAWLQRQTSLIECVAAWTVKRVVS
jgi:hypothetical protein